MNRLSDRLQLIADLVKAGESVADIGTDHGYLPLYLYEKGISPHVVLGDVSRESLNKAIENGKNYNPRPKEEDFRWGDGLKILKLGEVDVIVLAGMGGELMCKILEDSIELAKQVRLILQPRNHPELLRRFLRENGFTISHEYLTRENRFIWEIIVAEAGASEKCSDLDYLYPPELLTWREELLPEYLQWKLSKEKLLLSRLHKGKDVAEEIHKHEMIINRLEEMINEI
ncbi:MAG: class I SAM-dependent methyltransferase [Clostridia bacterium]|nr:class I SAM-dependent methyltransferase [Clostridia bacterium]